MAGGKMVELLGAAIDVAASNGRLTVILVLALGFVVVYNLENRRAKAQRVGSVVTGIPRLAKSAIAGALVGGVLGYMVPPDVIVGALPI